MVIQSVSFRIFLFLFVFLIPLSAYGQGASSIQIGEVSIASSDVDPSALSALRQALIGATRSDQLRNSHSSSPLVLTGSVTRLDSERVGARVRVNCEISLIVIDRRGGQMRALLTGRSRATGIVPRSHEQVRQMHANAIESAVTHAIEQLRIALQQNQL